MATIAPWISVSPQFFTGAMEAGSAAGTRQRAQAASETEAADRLRFAYDSLNRKEEQAAQLAAQKHELAKAAMELRGQQMKGLQDYRQQQIEAKQNELGLRQQLGEANLGLAGERLKVAQAKTPNAIHEPGVGIFQINPETGQYDLTTPFPSKATKPILSPVDSDMVKSMNKDIDEQRKLSLASTKKEDAARHEGNIDYLEQMKRGILKKAGAGPSLTAPSALTASSGAEIVRKTKDGRKAVFDAQTKKFIRYADEQPATDSSDTSHDEEE